MTRPSARAALGRLRALAAGRTGALLIARVLEQAAYGIVSLVLARWVGPDGYAVIGALLVFNSFAVVASDLGTGLAILSSDPGTVGGDQVRRMRIGAVVVGGGLVVGALVAEGRWAEALAWSALVWASSAEAFVRKAALLRDGRTRVVARLEIASSIAFTTVSLVGATIAPDHVVTVLGAACVAKHVLEVVGCRGWRAVLGPHGARRAGAVWASQVLAYAIANVDFVLVSALVSAAAFSLYSLGFRVAALVTSQVSFAVGRVVTLDLAGARPDGEAVRAVYVRAQRRLFLAGVVAGVGTLLAAPLLPVVLGDEWTGAAWVTAILAVATPWRMVLGFTGSLMLTADRASVLARFEVARLAVTAVVLAAAAVGGLWSFAAAAALVAIASTVVYDRLAQRSEGWAPRWWLTATVLPAAAIVAVLAALA